MKRLSLLGSIAFVVSLATGAAASSPTTPLAGTGVVRAPGVNGAVAATATAAPRTAYRRLSDVARPDASAERILPPMSREHTEHAYQTRTLASHDMRWGAHLLSTQDRVGAARNFGRGAQTTSELADFYKAKGVESFRAKQTEPAGKLFVHALNAYADAAEARMKQADALYDEVSQVGDRKAKGEALDAARRDMTKAFMLANKLGWSRLDPNHPNPVAERLVTVNTRLRDVSYAHNNPVTWK